MRISAGEAIARTLIVNGVDTLFGLPGAQTYPLFDALTRLKNEIRTVGVRHEQAAGYMALGYAKATGRLGVYSVVPGPGVLNSAAALATAWGTSAPVLCVTGQVPSRALGKGRGHLHELPDQRGTLASFVKAALRIERVEDVTAVVSDAIRIAVSGRPGPVTVEMSWDAMQQAGEVSLPAPVRADPHPALDAKRLADAVALIDAAEHPLILTGGGAQAASAEVRALAEKLGAPVAAFRGGRGVVAEDHPLSITSYAASLLYKQVDLIIGVGSRLEMPYMRWADMSTVVTVPPDRPKLVRIDIDPLEHARLKAHAPLLADAADGARALAQGVADKQDRDRTWFESARSEAERAIQVVQPHVDYLRVIRDAVPRDGFLVGELCQAGFTSYFTYPVYTPRTYVTEGYMGTLGFGFPTALGVKAAHPGRAVVSITGDGGFMFGMQELATAAEHKLALVTILFNNGSYGNVRRDFKNLYKSEAVTADYTNPDYQLLAKSFGVASAKVASPAELAPVLARALHADAPTLIEVSVPRDSEVSPWTFIHTKSAL